MQNKRKLVAIEPACWPTPGTRAELIADAAGKIGSLREKCLGFGIDVVESDLIAAGLLLLDRQTETALEVAILQALRADRSLLPRKTVRR